MHEIKYIPVRCFEVAQPIKCGEMFKEIKII